MMSTIKIWLKRKTLDRHTGVSPEDHSRHRFDTFRSDLSFFYSLIHFNYAKRKWSDSLS